jgi:hypothetical protein
MRAAAVALVGELAYNVPELLPLLEEHLEDQDGEVLPHIFMADVERWVEAGLVDEVGESRPAVRKLLALLEDAVVEGADESVIEVIHASFLEHLPQPGEPCAELREMLGPRLTARLRLIE